MDGAPQQVCTPSDAAEDARAPGGGGAAGLARLLVALVVFAAFAPLVRCDFGGFDDEINLVANPQLNPPTWDTLRHYWTRAEFDLYVPVTWTVWSATARIAWMDPPDALGRRLNPHVFHLLNVLLHTAAAVFVFEVLRRCLRDVWPAFAGALVFALHPLQVEPVAWIAGMKDVLAGVLALGALGMYMTAADAPSAPQRRLHWTLATLVFILAMLSKPNVVVLPAIALLLDWLVLKRLFRSAALRALPWFALAIPCIVWTRMAQPASFVAEDVPLHLRPLVAADALAFYLYKLVWPARLAVDYGRTPQLVIERGWMTFAWTIPIILAIGASMLRRRAPVLVAAIAVVVVALTPVLGIIPFDFQAYSTVADHYAYLPMLGLALAAGWLASRRPRALALAVMLLVVAALAARSVMQQRHWRDARAIFEHALEVNPRSWAAHSRLAEHHAGRGDVETALVHARRSVEANERFFPGHRMMGENLARLGRTDEALGAYRAALRIEPDDAISHTNLANLLAERGRREEAIAHYRAALRQVPHSVIVHTNLGITLEELGRHDEAAQHYRRALAINPSATEARKGLQRLERSP